MSQAASLREIAADPRLNSIVGHHQTIACGSNLFQSSHVAFMATKSQVSCSRKRLALFHNVRFPVIIFITPLSYSCCCPTQYEHRLTTGTTAIDLEMSMPLHLTTRFAAIAALQLALCMSASAQVPGMRLLDSKQAEASGDPSASSQGLQGVLNHGKHVKSLAAKLAYYKLSRLASDTS